MVSNLEEAKSVVGAATGCRDHLIDCPDESSWKRVVAACSGCCCYMRTKGGGFCDNYCDSYGVCVIELNDGTYFVASENSDTTGHGCRCSGSVTYHKTLEDAIRLGLTDDERIVLDLPTK